MLAKEFSNKIQSNRYMELKYENLVCAPRKSIEMICNFLGIDYRQSMLKHHKIADKLGDTTLSHHSRVHAPIDTRSIGKWKSRLTKSDQIRVQNWLGTLLSDLEYI